MKKLIVTLAIVLGMGMSVFAQDVEVYQEKGLFGHGRGIFTEGNNDDQPFFDFEHGTGTDQDADAPLGSGIAMLVGLGAAYAIGKKRMKE